MLSVIIINMKTRLLGDPFEIQLINKHFCFSLKLSFVYCMINIQVCHNLLNDILVVRINYGYLMK